MSFSIAIDGPAGAGKSTIAKMIAKKYKLMYINTGAMYRAVAYIAIKNHILPENKEGLKDLINSLNMKFEGDNLIVNDIDISSELNLPFISNNVSDYAAIPYVREILIKLQRGMALNYNVIMDGRDIGSFVLKNAELKFFLTASAQTRAERRFSELKAKGLDVDYNEILDGIIKRDYMDTNRKLNPLMQAEDAVVIDSSYLNIEEVTALISEHMDNIAANLLQKDG